MILFDLICSQGHGFEAWFRDGDSFDRLAAVDEIRCAVCGDAKVRKALMAPNISTSKAVDDQGDKEPAEGSAAAVSGAKETKSGEALPSAPADASPSMAVQENGGPLDRPTAIPVPEKVAEAMRVLRQVQSHIEQTFDHVGRQFAEEARKMHYGEVKKRSIYGEATKDEAEQLAEEGIEVDQMPWLPPRNG